MGHGYRGDPGHHHTIAENIGELTARFEYSNGYFGKTGQGRAFVRNISSDDPLKTAEIFYRTAAYGGIERILENGKGTYSKMSDGTIISFRETSSSDGSPVVEINIRSSSSPGELKYQKIHFIRRQK